MAKTSTSLSSNEVNKSTNEDRQAGFVEQTAARVRERAEAVNVSYSQIMKGTGVSSSAMANYWTGKRPWPTEHLSTVADLLSTSVDSLLGRQQRPLLIDADDAEWVDVPEYLTHEIDEMGKLTPVTTTLMRKDWLYASLGDTSGVWMARAPTRNDALNIDAGTMLFCKDHRPGERMIHGAYYLFRVNGGIILARFSLRDGNDGEETVLARDLGQEEDQYIAVARVIGEYARPL